jgi:hypothetical protein
MSLGSFTAQSMESSRLAVAFVFFSSELTKEFWITGDELEPTGFEGDGGSQRDPAKPADTRLSLHIVNSL